MNSDGRRRLDVSEAIRSRRSVRRFDLGRPVPRELIERCVDAARWAPSSCNLQTWDFVVVTDEAVRRELAKECKSVLVAPVCVFVVYDRELAREGLANVQSASAATMNLLLEATSLGLASLWVNALGDRAAVRRLLGVPDEYEVLAMVALGWPAGDPPPPPERRPLREVLHWERYSGRGPLPRSPDPAAWTPEQLAVYLKRKLESGTRFNKPNPAFFLPVLEAVVESLPDDAGREGFALLDLLSNTGLFAEALGRRFPKARLAVLETGAEAWFFAERRVGRPVEFAPFPEREAERILSACAAEGEPIRLARESGGLPVVPRRLPRPRPARGPYDAATCLFRLEGIAEPLRRELLEQAARFVRPGGRLVLAYVSSRSWHTPLFALRRRLGRDTVETSPVPDPNLIGPFEALAPGAVHRLAEAAGWRWLSERTLFPLPRPQLLGERFVRRSGAPVALLSAACAALGPFSRLLGPFARVRVACLERPGNS